MKSKKSLYALFGLLLIIVCATAIFTSRGVNTPRVLPVSSGWGFPITISPNNRYLATTTNARTDAVELYDFKTGQVRVLTTYGVNQFYAYQMSCAAMTFSPDSKTVADAGEDVDAYPGYSAPINTWDTATGAHLSAFGSTIGTSLLYTPDGKFIAAAGKDKCIHLWNPVTGRSVKTIPGPGGQITSFAISPDGQRIAIGTIVPMCALQVRDMQTGKALWTQQISTPLSPMSEAEVSSLAFSPDGSTLARGGQNNRVYLHDATTGALRATLSDPTPGDPSNYTGHDAARAVAYSPDGRYLASGGVYRVVIWSTQTNTVAMRPDQMGQPFAFTSNSKAIAVTSSALLSPHPPRMLRLGPFRIMLGHQSEADGRVRLWPLN